MRRAIFMTVAAAAVGLGVSQPAAAWDDSHGVGSVYVHHHVYGPVRTKHVYHLHKAGPEHVHVVHFPYTYRRHTAGGYFKPWHDPRGYGYRWYWWGSRWH
jgi:hypothetical protein